MEAIQDSMLPNTAINVLTNNNSTIKNRNSGSLLIRIGITMINKDKRLPYLQINTDSKQAIYLGYVLPLTPSEYEVLSAVFYIDDFCDKEKIKSIIDENNTKDTKISLSAIPVHIFSINKKSILAGGRKLIENIKKQGYIINPYM